MTWWPLPQRARRERFRLIDKQAEEIDDAPIAHRPSKEITVSRLDCDERLAREQPERTSAIALTRATLPLMARRRYGRIVDRQRARPLPLRSRQTTSSHESMPSRLVGTA
jgi:hypothetical protein